jgi:hypothetical protein
MPHQPARLKPQARWQSDVLARLAIGTGIAANAGRPALVRQVSAHRRAETFPFCPVSPSSLPDSLTRARAGWLP